MLKNRFFPASLPPSCSFPWKHPSLWHCFPQQVHYFLFIITLWAVIVLLRVQIRVISPRYSALFFNQMATNEIEKYKTFIIAASYADLKKKNKNHKNTLLWLSSRFCLTSPCCRVAKISLTGLMSTDEAKCLPPPPKPFGISSPSSALMEMGSPPPSLDISHLHFLCPGRESFCSRDTHICLSNGGQASLF